MEGRFPEEDWSVLRTSLWQPWCGHVYPGAIQVLDADGVGHEAVATTSPGTVYIHGHPKPGNISTREAGHIKCALKFYSSKFSFVPTYKGNLFKSNA